VEGIASKSPKELTELVEKISGSARFKGAYDEARLEVEAREEAFTQSFEQKRFVVRERAQLKAQKDEAEEYQQILGQFQASKVNLTLFQLFHLQHDIDAKTKQAQQEAKVRTSITTAANCA
jgi:structural maintenance of chromosome 1